MKIYRACALFFLFFFLPVWLKAQYNFNVKRTIRETSHQVLFASYSPDGKYIITTGSDNSVIIWNSENGIIYRTLTGLRKRPNVAVFTNDNKHILSGGEDNLVSMWDPIKLEIIHTFKGHTGAVKSLDISPDGRYLATGSADKTIRVWALNSRELIYELKAHKNVVNALSFSLDGSMLASGGADKSLILWSIQNGNIINSITAHKGWIRDIAFSPDGKTLATCGDDNLIHIWDLPGLTKVITMEGHKSWVQTIAFSPDGKSLISGGHDHIIILWDINSGKILHQSTKQGHILLSVDIHPGRPDFISANLLSEEIRVWALTGLDPLQWDVGTRKQPTGIEISHATPKGKIKSPGTSPSPDANPKIEIYSPVAVRGRIMHDKSEILLVGRVSDPNGINVFMINNKQVNLNDAGIFQYKMNLQAGQNSLNLLAVNNEGILNEYNMLIDFQGESSLNPYAELPDIQKSRYFALLIGINEYSDDNIIDLDNPIRDVEELSKVLISRYNFEKENVVLLKNPGRAEMFVALDELTRILTIHDNLLIFYAGHGHWDDKGKVGYWLPADASRYSTVEWFRNSTLRDFIGSINTRHTMLIADACFSGAIFKTRAAFTEVPKSIQKLYELPSRKAMTSGILQEVPDESIFVKYLIKRLEENDEKFLSSEVLFSSFKTVVMNNSPNIPQYGVIQNVGDEGGDFVFIRK